MNRLSTKIDNKERRFGLVEARAADEDPPTERHTPLIKLLQKIFLPPNMPNLSIDRRPPLCSEQLIKTPFFPARQLGTTKVRTENFQKFSIRKLPTQIFYMTSREQFTLNLTVRPTRARFRSMMENNNYLRVITRIYPLSR